MRVHTPGKVALVLTCCGVCGVVGCIIPATQDFSGFDQFEFVRSGTCDPDLDGTVLSASITQANDGGYELDLTVIDAGAEGVDECDPNFAWWGCYVVRDLAPRELTAQEIGEMQAIFETARVETVLFFPICVTPCEFRYATWDGVELTDLKSCMGFIPYRALSGAQMEEIIAFLESLAVETD